VISGYCTTPFPVPFREEDFPKVHVAYVIENQASRKASMPSFISHKLAEDRAVGSQYADYIIVSDVRDDNDINLQTALTPTKIQPNTSLYFLFRIELSCIGQTTMDDIYSPGSASLAWGTTEAFVSRNNASLDDWLARLPSYYNFDKPSSEPAFLRQRISLAFRFYSIKLITLEPCLRRVIELPCGDSCSIPCQEMGALCIQIAGSVLNLIPEVPDIPWLYGHSPWWSILHYVVQCSTILLLGLARRTKIISINVEETVRNIRKASRWLQELSRTDESSRRACMIFFELAAHYMPDLVLVSNSAIAR
jgi:hypothetical protein